VERIVAAREEGHSAAEVARLYRVSKRSVERYWKKYRITGGRRAQATGWLPSLASARARSDVARMDQAEEGPDPGPTSGADRPGLGDKVGDDGALASFGKARVEL